ncbi:MAG: PKD domain-containing protein [Methanomassiliicoccus sp.]|nr:PKD domain-containing protein [Methanomassiliicoccus sp.]
METRLNKALSSIAIVSMLLLMATVLVVPAPAQAVWRDASTLAITPGELYPGENAEITYTLTIPQPEGADSLTITRIEVLYSWNILPIPLTTPSAPATSFPFTYTFTNTVSVPANTALGDQTGAIAVSAYINSDFANPTTKSFSHEFSVSAPLAATATATPTAGQAPQKVDFDVTASGGSGGYKYLWDFGDGKTSTNRNPSNTYTTGGTFAPRVTVTDSLGRNVTASTASVTIGSPMTASITASKTGGPAPLTVDFTSVIGNGTGPFTYLWDFGDGSTSDVANPSHVYDTPGDYTVNLTVTDPSDRIAYASEVVIRASESPNVKATITATPLNGTAPLTVAFNSVVENGTYPYTYLWTFGDGATSEEASPSHTYSTAGIYVARLTVTDSTDLRVDSLELEIVVTSVTDMVAHIQASNLTGSAPLNVAFNSTIENGTPRFWYNWTFGDGTKSALESPEHIYTEPGTYKVKLTVIDSDANLVQSNELTIVVEAPGGMGLSTTAWIWISTGAIVAAVGAASFLMIRFRK